MYYARGDQLGVLGARWSPPPPWWSCGRKRGVRMQRVMTQNSCATCLAHWQSTRLQSWCNLVSVIKTDVVLQQDWKQIAASLPEGDPKGTKAYNQAWRSCLEEDRHL